MTDRIFKNWSLFRVLRLGFGLFFLVDGIVTGVWPMMFFGTFFTILPLFDLGCCGTGNCTTVSKPTDDFEDEEVIFEEVKLKKD